MKLLIRNNKIIGTADSSYNGIDLAVDAPIGFEYAKANEYTVLNNEVVISKDLIWERIKSIRDKKTQDNGYQVDTKWYHSDTFSRTQQLGLVLLGANIPANLLWKTMDGTFVEMTQTLAGQIFAAGAASDQALFAYSEVLKAAIDASETPETVDINIGWPIGYGEQ